MAAMLLWAVTAIAGFLGLQVAKKTLITAAAITAFVVLTVALVLAITTGLNAIATGSVTLGLVDATIVRGLGLFIPSNAGPVVGVVLAAHVARRIYDINMGAVQLLATS